MAAVTANFMIEDLPTLVDAICEAYDHPDYRAKVVSDNPITPLNEYQKITYCNFVVQSIARRMGYKGFEGRLANSMIDLMEKSAEWVSTDYAWAQEHANKGRLVVAGLKKQPHGHVVVIRPGKPVWSNRENKFVPRCLHIGATAFIGSVDKKSAGVNFAFPSMPNFFLWQGNIL